MKIIMFKETPDNLAHKIQSEIHELFLKYYPHFQGNKNFSGLSDKAAKELIERLNLIRSDTKSNGIGLHKKAREYNFLEQACHLDSMENVHQMDISHPNYGVLQSQRREICLSLGLMPEATWETIARYIIHELGQEISNIDATRWQISEGTKDILK